MTRAVWFNCCAGVAGDMMLAALVDAGADPLAVMDAWGALGVDGFAASWERVQRCGVSSLWTNVAIDGHEHGSSDPTAHVHRPAREVLALIEGADLAERVRRDATAVYRRLAEVEGTIHGSDPAEVELHEVGALDSILDIVGICAALHDLGVEELTTDIHCVTHWTKQGTTWSGVPVRRVFDDAGVGAADHALVYSYGDYTTNLPVEDLVDRDAMFAVAFEGEPIDAEHGGPVRLLVPHLYLWKSAKWVREIRLADEPEQGFWEAAGYHDYGDPWSEQRYHGD